MRGGQLAQTIDGRGVNDEFRTIGGLPIDAEDTALHGLLSVDPKTEADDIGLRNSGEIAGHADVGSSRGLEGAERSGRVCENALKKMNLEIEERLIYMLAALPTEDGNGNLRKALSGVSRDLTGVGIGSEHDTALGVRSEDRIFLHRCCGRCDDVIHCPIIFLQGRVQRVLGLFAR